MNSASSSYDVVAGIAIILMMIGFACAWRFAARLNFVVAGLLGFATFFVVMLGLAAAMAAWQYDTDMRWMAIYVGTVPVIYGIGALARHRALKARGK